MSVNSQAADCWCEVSSRGHRVVLLWPTELLLLPYLSAGGLFPRHQAGCIYISCSPSSSFFAPSFYSPLTLPHPPAHHLFYHTSTAVTCSRFSFDKPHNSACVSLWFKISLRAVIMGSTPFPILQFYLPLCPLCSVCFLLSREPLKWCNQEGVTAHYCAEQSFWLLFLLFSGTQPSWQYGGCVRIRGCCQGQWKHKGFWLEMQGQRGNFLFVSWNKLYLNVNSLEDSLYTRLVGGCRCLMLGSALLLVLQWGISFKCIFIVRIVIWTAIKWTVPARASCLLCSRPRLARLIVVLCVH